MSLKVGIPTLIFMISRVYVGYIGGGGGLSAGYPHVFPRGGLQYAVSVCVCIFVHTCGRPHSLYITYIYYIYMRL